MGVVAEIPSPPPAAPAEKDAMLLLMHIFFACVEERDGDLPPIWEAVVKGNGKTEGLATLNQALMRGLPACCRVFGGRAHFSASLTLMSLIKSASL